MKTYDVTVRAQVRCVGLQDESTFQVVAKDRGQALKRARQVMRWEAGHTRHDGGLTYSAKVAKAAERPCNS